MAATASLVGNRVPTRNMIVTCSGRASGHGWRWPKTVLSLDVEPAVQLDRLACPCGLGPGQLIGTALELAR